MAMSSDCAACESMLANEQKPGKDKLSSFISGRMDPCLTRALAEKAADAQQLNFDAVKDKTQIMTAYGTLFEQGSKDKGDIHKQCEALANNMLNSCGSMMNAVFALWNKSPPY